MVRCLLLVAVLVTVTACVAEEERVSQQETTQADEAARQREKEQERQRILQARRLPMEEQYVFSPKRVSTVEAARPPVVDGRLEEECWQQAEPVSGLRLLEKGSEATQQTEVRLCHRGGVLYVGFRCHEAAMGERPSPEIPDYKPGDWDQQADTLQLYFSVTNDHTNYYRLVIGPTGHTKLFTGYRLRGELPTDVMQNEVELFRGPSFSCEIADEAEAWTGEVAIPASAFGLAGSLTGQVWGFNVVRVRRAAPEEVSTWCPSPGSPVVLPVDFGELFFGQTAVTVVSVDLGKPFWGENSARVTLSNVGPVPRGVRLLSHVYLPVDEETHFQAEQTEQLAGGESREITVPYKLSWRGKWPVYAEYCQRVSLRVEDAETGALIHSTSYPIAFDVGLKPNERYGQKPDAPNPSPDDPDFITKKRDFIIGRLPEFRRLTTAEGAESDFVLAAARGRVPGRVLSRPVDARPASPAVAHSGSLSFDLMEEGAIQDIADWLYGLFDNDTDRMLAAIFFVHQRTVTRHSGSLSRLGTMTPLSILRRGGGLCDSRAQALAGILSRMTRDATGQPFRCHCLGLKGHVVCAVEAVPEPEDVTEHWVLDPDVGMFYFTRDNTRLATLGELRSDRQLSYRMNFNNVRHSHEFYFSADNFTYDWEKDQVWPEGAPAW